MASKRKLDACDTDVEKAKSKLQCDLCQREFTQKCHLTRHLLSHAAKVKCAICGEQFGRRDNLLRHERNIHLDVSSTSERKWSCVRCSRLFRNSRDLFHHVTTVHLIDQSGDRMEDIRPQSRSTYENVPKATDDKETKSLRCHLCQTEFTRKSHLVHHVVSHSARVKCSLCQKQFNRNSNLLRHKRLVHGGESSAVDAEWTCVHCGQIFTSYQPLFAHVTTNHPIDQHGGRASDVRAMGVVHENVPPKENIDIPVDAQADAQDSALNDSVQDHTLYPRGSDRYDMLSFFAAVKQRVMELLLSGLRRHGLKWYLTTQVELYKENDEGQEIVTARPFFRSRTYATLNTDTLREHDLNEAFQKMSQSFENYLRESSGWSIRKVLQLKLHTIVYRPLLHGSSYMPLPKTLRSVDIVNIRNRDQKCFAWSVLASIYPVDTQPDLVRHYESHEHELRMTGITYPVSIAHIDRFEAQNADISVNVFGCEGRDLVPLKITSNVNREHHVNLLLLRDERGSHYCLIRDLNAFLSRTKSDGYKHFFCWYCLHGFMRADLLQEHVPYCSIHGAQKITLPNPRNNILEFKEYEKLLRVPFVIYCDFETLNKKLQSCDPDPSRSSTNPNTLLEPCSYGYKIVCIEPKYTTSTVIYRGPDAAQRLIACLLKEKKEIEDILSNVEPMRLTDEDRRDYDEATTCCICNRPFDHSNDRVRHHCHVTGKYIGCAHSNCNLQCRQADFIPVIFHGLRNFDAHCLCQGIGVFKEEKIQCIPQNLERYVSFSLGSLRFIDSYQFLSSSLETLVSDLSEIHDRNEPNLHAFPHLVSEFPFADDARLLVRKGVYPYEFMDDESKFDLPHLPPREAFYSSLTKTHISTDLYAHAWTVFNEFCHQNMGDYHDLYLRTDVLLLCDVFEAFRTMALKQYGLDPCHFYTSPGLSWSAMLKMTQVRIHLMTDIDQLVFVENSIRGGVSVIANRYKKANNRYLSDYDTSKPCSYLAYVDCNNLYGWSMSQPLPLRDFRFLTQEEIEAFEVLSIPADDPKGYILEVSLAYPQRLHDLHNDFPLAPVAQHVENEQLSPYAMRVLKKLHGLTAEDALPPRAKGKKLLTTLKDKDNYILHYRNLQLYLSLGLELKAVHRIMEFHQEAWMKPYIDFNTEMRKKAKTPFQKNLFKLMNNSCFGKTMENLRRHRNVELCHNPKRVAKLSAKPTYHSHRIFSEDLVAVELTRAKVLLNKPVFCGAAILDLSKFLMYDFFYNHLKAIYGSKLQLQFSDTDSYLFHCFTSDIFQDVKDHLELYDTSDFPPDHELQSNANKKVMGKFKFETNEKCISEFVGLRAKMYSFRCGEKEEKKAKGIGKTTVSKDLTFDMYKGVLFSESQLVSSTTKISSHSHRLFCETNQQVGLSCFDDKRYLLDDGIHSLAYGHYTLMKNA